jgi:hypothetical protein
MSVKTERAGAAVAATGPGDFAKHHRAAANSRTAAAAQVLLPFVPRLRPLPSEAPPARDAAAAAPHSIEGGRI